MKRQYMTIVFLFYVLNLFAKDFSDILKFSYGISSSKFIMKRFSNNYRYAYNDSDITKYLDDKISLDFKFSIIFKNNFIGYFGLYKNFLGPLNSNGFRKKFYPEEIYSFNNTIYKTDHYISGYYFGIGYKVFSNIYPFDFTFYAGLNREKLTLREYNRFDSDNNQRYLMTLLAGESDFNIGYHIGFQMEYRIKDVGFYTFLRYTNSSINLYKFARKINEINLNYLYFHYPESFAKIDIDNRNIIIPYNSNCLKLNRLEFGVGIKYNLGFDRNNFERSDNIFSQKLKVEFNPEFVFLNYADNNFNDFLLGRDFSLSDTTDSRFPIYLGDGRGYNIKVFVNLNRFFSLYGGYNKINFDTYKSYYPFLRYNYTYELVEMSNDILDDFKPQENAGIKGYFLGISFTPYRRKFKIEPIFSIELHLHTFNYLFLINDLRYYPYYKKEDCSFYRRFGYPRSRFYFNANILTKKTPGLGIGLGLEYKVGWLTIIPEVKFMFDRFRIKRKEIFYMDSEFNSAFGSEENYDPETDSHVASILNPPIEKNFSQSLLELSYIKFLIGFRLGK